MGWVVDMVLNDIGPNWGGKGSATVVQFSGRAENAEDSIFPLSSIDHDPCRVSLGDDFGVNGR